MKRTLLIVLSIMFLACAGSFAGEVTGSMTATVMVSGSFFLIVNSDSFDFARLLPGQTGEMSRAEGINVTGSSAGGDPWYLKVSAVNALSSGSDSIPNEDFTWYGTSEGSGNWYGVSEQSFADNSGSAYISSKQESDYGTKVASKFKFRLHVPTDTRPGSYTTTVMFTMTE